MRALLVAGFLAPLAFAGGADEALLRGKGIEPTAAGIGRFLRELVPTDRELDAAATFARQLGGSPFERENATRKLELGPVASIGALRAAVESPDPEVRRRARPLLERAMKRLPVDELLASLRLVATQRMQGLAGEIVRAAHYCFGHYALDCAERALAATVAPADRGLLVDALASTSATTRATALAGLRALGGPEVGARLRMYVDDASPLVRVVAARALLDRGEAAAFATLLSLLEADEPSVRSRAAHALRYALGKSFDYDAFDPPEERAAAALRWRGCVAALPERAEWRRPLPPAPVRHGRTLIALFNGRRVIELDDEGHVVWQRSYNTPPWIVVGLPSGDRLVAFYTRHSLARYDRNGREVWRREELPSAPTSVQPLPDGGLLVACGYQGIVLRLNWDGTTAWEREIHGKPTGARLLPDGHRLLTLHEHGRVVEVDAEGRVLWSLPNLLQPYSATRLANGNTLVCELGIREENGRVSEWTRAGELVWELPHLRWNYRAQRLPNGRTVVSARNGVFVVKPGGEKQELYTTNDYIWVDRY